MMADLQQQAAINEDGSSGGFLNTNGDKSLLTATSLYGYNISAPLLQLSISASFFLQKAFFGLALKRFNYISLAKTFGAPMFAHAH